MISLRTAGLLLSLACLLAAGRGEAIWSFPWFLVLVGALVWLPGTVLLDAARVRPGRALDDLALALALGTAAAGGAYWLAGSVGRSALFWLWPVVCGFVAVRRRTSLLGRLTRLRDGWRAGDVGIPLALTVAVLAPYAFLPLFYSNLAPTPSGGLTFYHLPDLVLHASLAQEVAHTVPPRWPFLPGYAVSYHYLMDLLPAAFAAGGLALTDLVVRFLPTLLTTTTLLCVYAGCRAWHGSPVLGGLTAVLVFFGEDFSWIPGLVVPQEAPWATAYFGVPTTPSLYMLNPMLPALGVAFSALLCLRLFLQGEGRGHAVLAAVFLAVVLPQYKIFTAAHLLAGLGLAGLFSWWRSRDGRLLAVTALCAALLVPSLLLRWDSNTKTRVLLLMQPWPYVLGSVVRLGLWEAGWLTPLRALYVGHGSFLGVLQYLGCILMYLAGSLGARCLALPGVLRAWRGDPLRFAVALCILLGPLLTLTVSVVVPGLPPSRQYNNAIWFYVQSKYLAWLFVVEAVRGWIEGPSRGVRIAVLLAVLLGALPSGAQYFLHQQAVGRQSVLSPALMQVVDDLSRRARPGDVLWAREHLTEQIISLVPCHGLSLDAFPYLVLEPARIAVEAARREAFWEAWRRGRLEPEALRSWKVRFVLVERAYDGTRGSAGAPPALKPVYENAEFSLYEVEAD